MFVRQKGPILAKIFNKDKAKYFAIVSLIVPTSQYVIQAEKFIHTFNSPS